jgi:hypothetical protein
VIEVYRKTNLMVCVLWDPMPDVKGSEELSATNAILLSRKWRKKTEDGEWMLTLLFKMNLMMKMIQRT